MTTSTRQKIRYRLVIKVSGKPAIADLGARAPESRLADTTRLHES